MIIEWFFGIILSSSLQGFCNAREIFVSLLGNDNMNCTTMDNPCLTIQYAVDKVAIVNDFISIDGSLGNFTVKSEVQISNCMNLTFTSYNGVAWIYGDRQTWPGFSFSSYFLTLDCPKNSGNCEMHFNTINFRNIKLIDSSYYHEPYSIANMTLTIRNCLFDLSGAWEYGGMGLVIIESKYSFITIEDCTIKASCNIGILRYPPRNTCTKFPSIQIILKNTHIEDAWYTVQEDQHTCIHAVVEKGSKLTVINSIISSRGKCKSGNPQFWFVGGPQKYQGDLLVISLVNSRFENLSVPIMTAAVMKIKWISRVFIINCTFKGNIGVVGGAMYLQSNHLTIVDSKFYDNEARIITLCGLKDQEGNGGAIFLDSSNHPHTVNIYNSSFINNKATCVGSSIYLGDAHEIVVRQTQFITSFTSSSDTIWFSSSSNLLLDQVSFEARQDSMQGGKLFLSRTAKLSFSERTPVFNCPIGSMLHLLDSNHGIFRTRRVTCQYCQNGTYTLTSSNMSGFNVIQNKQKIPQPQCQSCSFGAVCQHGIKPRPNFWGYVHKGKAFMIVCPPGYCCQTSDQCISLNSCNNKRTGRLCGKCKHGYFQSVFTNDCLEEKVCKTGKFWALVIITCLLFTFMFIFLQDIFFCIVKILNMDSLSSLVKRTIKWFAKMPLLVRMDGSQLDQRDENESYSNREGKEVEGNDGPENDEGNTMPNNNSTAAGLIKIVFFFYQIHSLLTVYIPDRKTQFLIDLKALVLSIFNLHAQVPLNSEFHCPLHGMGSITKVWIKALFPVNCLVFAGFLFAFVVAFSHLFSNSDFIQRYSMKAKPKLLTAILQLILLGYSTIASSILSLVTCISVNDNRILYIDGNVPCYQTWQYAILIFIALWAIPLIYALHKLPTYMRKGEITVRGIFAALLLPLPFAIYSMMKGVRKVKSVTSDGGLNNQSEALLIPYIRMKPINVTMLQLLNVVEGPFRYKTSREEGEKLSWESILLLQRILLSLCHTFVLQPGMRSLLLLLFIIIFLYMNARYQPFSSGLLNAINGITFILLCITSIFNEIYAFIFEYGDVPNEPLAQLLYIFDYLEVVMIMIFPVILLAILAILVATKVIAYLYSVIGFLIAKCKRCYCNDD